MTEIDINKVVRKYVTGSCTPPAELVGNLCDALEAARAERDELARQYRTQRLGDLRIRAEKAEAQIAAVREVLASVQPIKLTGLREGQYGLAGRIRTVLDGPA